MTGKVGGIITKFISCYTLWVPEDWKPHKSIFGLASMSLDAIYLCSLPKTNYGVWMKNRWTRWKRETNEETLRWMEKITSTFSLKLKYFKPSMAVVIF